MVAGEARAAAGDPLARVGTSLGSRVPPERDLRLRGVTGPPSAELGCSALNPLRPPTRCAGVGVVATLAPPPPSLVLVPTGLAVPGRVVVGARLLPAP
eukprot:15465140-Alexandrium_andersonii.AAC.2